MIVTCASASPFAGTRQPAGAAHCLRAFIPIGDARRRRGTYHCAMATASARGAKFGAGRLLVSDSRLTLGALNYARYRALHRVFGVSRAEANLLTFVLALAAVDPAARVARRVARAPRALTGAGSGMSGFTVREAALGIAGPGVREGSARRDAVGGRDDRGPRRPQAAPCSVPDAGRRASSARGAREALQRRAARLRRLTAGVAPRRGREPRRPSPPRAAQRGGARSPRDELIAAGEVPAKRAVELHGRQSTTTAQRPENQIPRIPDVVVRSRFCAKSRGRVFR